MKIITFLRIVELRTKIVSLSTFSLALLYSLYRAGTVPAYLAVLTFLAAMAVDMGTTAFNTYFDFIRQVDHKDENREKDKVLVHEGVDPGHALLSALGCYAAAVLLGGSVALLSGWPVAAAGALSMAVGFFYTGGPRPLSSTPLGELFAGGFLGSVFFLIVVYILTGKIAAADIAASIPSALMIASVLSVNNACDIEGDTRAGRRTLAILLGRPLASYIIPLWGILAVLTLGMLTATGILPRFTPIPLAAAALPAAAEYRGMFRAGFSHDTKGTSMGRISRILLLYTAAYAAALTAGLLF
jgi:1,4-dihydroxy-2-naphthoate polyprenyltransferase